ncbi:RTA1 domain protein [Penicillium herquei]|nr:RTA1 domain protein [Penicillium herquei]
MTGSSIYGYTPSEAAAIFASAAFGTSAFFHAYQTWKYQAKFWTVFLIGAFMMTLGYIARCISIKSPSALGPYIMQYILILLPPSLYAASIYMIFGRIVNITAQPRLSLVSPEKVTKIFVIGDLVSFLTQLGGGSMEASTSTASLGSKILMVGLFVQLLSFGLFLSTAVVFEVRLRKLMLFREATSWRTLLYLLFAASALIIIRCIYRMMEAGQGSTGYFATHEAFIYCFDMLPMLTVQTAFHFCPPGRALRPKRGQEKDTEMYSL